MVTLQTPQKVFYHCVFRNKELCARPKQWPEGFMVKELCEEGTKAAGHPAQWSHCWCHVLGAVTGVHLYGRFAE